MNTARKFETLSTISHLASKSKNCAKGYAQVYYLNSEKKEIVYTNGFYIITASYDCEETKTLNHLGNESYLTYPQYNRVLVEHGEKYIEPKNLINKLRSITANPKVKNHFLIDKNGYLIDGDLAVKGETYFNPYIIREAILTAYKHTKSLAITKMTVNKEMLIIDLGQYRIQLLGLEK